MFVAVPPTADTEAPIPCGDFLPAIDPAEARARMRIDGTITPERLREALIEAAATVAGELREWIATQIAAGHATLAAVPADQIDGKSTHVHRYRRAVLCLATAELIERLRDYDSTNDGHEQADKLTPTIDELRRDARWAVLDIRGQRRTTVELI